MTPYERLQNLQSRRSELNNSYLVAQEIKDNPAFRQEIDDLHEAFIGGRVGGCSDCYLDAFNVLMTITSEPSKFRVYPGTLLADDEPQDKWITRAKCTDELAIYWLRKNPDLIKHFSHYPENWKELISVSNDKKSDTHVKDENITSPNRNKVRHSKVV